MKTASVIHEIPPVYDKNSKVLILGSFPSVKSRESRFFYGHPQNRFWRVLSEIFWDTLPVTMEEKKRFLIKHHVAVWDVIAQCTITGSSDSSIRDVTVNDIGFLLEQTEIQQIYCNGATAYQLYHKYCEPLLGRSAAKLPSTSPANAGWGLERLVEAWSCIKEGQEDLLH